MSGAKLHYFDGRGKGETIRLMLAACGIPFTEEFLTKKEQITKLRSDGMLLFDQVPMLEIDGQKLVQSSAICRYLARKGGLYGNNNDQVTRIDVLFDGSRDFLNFFIAIGFMDEKEVLEKAADKALPRYLPVFENVLKENGTGYLVGAGLTMADIGLLEPLLMTVEYFGEDSLKEYPSIQKFFHSVSALDKISVFLKGPQRKKQNDDHYIATVKGVLY